MQSSHYIEPRKKSMKTVLNCFRVFMDYMYNNIFKSLEVSQIVLFLFSLIKQFWYLNALQWLFGLHVCVILFFVFAKHKLGTINSLPIHVLPLKCASPSVKAFRQSGIELTYVIKAIRTTWQTWTLYIWQRLKWGIISRQKYIELCEEIILL